GGTKRECRPAAILPRLHRRHENAHNHVRGFFDGNRPSQPVVHVANEVILLKPETWPARNARVERPQFERPSASGKPLGRRRYAPHDLGLPPLSRLIPATVLGFTTSASGIVVEIL